MVYLAIDWESFKLFGKYALYMLGLLLLVYLIAVITPWLARKIDNRKPKPERVKKGLYEFEKDELKSVFEAQSNNENGDECSNGKQQ